MVMIIVYFFYSTVRWFFHCDHSTAAAWQVGKWIGKCLSESPPSFLLMRHLLNLLWAVFDPVFSGYCCLCPVHTHAHVHAFLNFMQVEDECRSIMLISITAVLSYASVAKRPGRKTAREREGDRNLGVKMTVMSRQMKRAEQRGYTWKQFDVFSVLRRNTL